MTGSSDVTDSAGAATEPPELDDEALPYRYDPALVPALAHLADAACDGVTDPHDAGLRIDALARQADPPIFKPAASVLFNTFMYLIRTAAVESPPDARLEPLDGPSLFPMALREASEDHRQLWLQLGDHVEHPIAQARCWDIIFTLTLIRNRRQAAERATRAYLDACATTLSLRHKADGLLRAWTMARLIGLKNLDHELAEAMLTVAEAAVTGRDDPYAAMTVLGALIAPPPRGTAHAVEPAVDELLDRALVTFPQVHIIRDFAVLVRKSAGNGTARAEHASRHEIGAMLAEAEATTDPMIIRTRFGEAAAAARRLGLADLEQVAVARLQAAPPLTWETTEWAVTTPAAFFNHYLPGFAAATDWREALSVWLHTGAPSGNRLTNEATARQVLQSSVFHLLVTTVLFRGGDLPSRTLNSDDAIFDRELVRAEAHYLDMNGRFLARALYQIRERFGIPCHDDLEEFLQGFGAAPALVATLATALQLYWIDEYDASCHLVVPKVEAAARAVLLELNEPLYRAAVGDAVGQFPGLGSLLPSLIENDFDPDWERFLRTFLLSDGSNVRNLVAHGFADRVGPIEAALAVRAGALLILLTTEDAIARDASTVRAALATPTDRPIRRSWRQRLVAALLAARRELHS